MPERKTVVLLNPDPRLLPESIAVEQRIRSTLEPAFGSGIDIYTEYLDLGSLSEDRSERLLTRFLRQKHQGRKVDLVIPITFPVLRFFLKHRAELFPGVPAIFCAANLDAIKGLDLGPDITGVRLRSEWGATLEAALKVDPGIRQVIVITGTAEIGRDLEAAAAEDLDRYRERVALTYLTGLPMAQLLDAVARLPKDSIVLFVSLLRDGAGRLFTNPEAVSLIARASSVPVYSWSETYLGLGIVGGHLASFEAQGTRAAELGLRILRGEKPKNVPIVDGEGAAYIFDGRQLRRWGIGENQLPQGSIVRYQDPSLWAVYRGYVVGGVLILGVMSLMWALHLQRAGRRRVELSLDERLRFESLLSKLSAGLIHISLNDLDDEINRGLRRVGEFLKVDRANLHEYVVEGAIVRISWAVEGIEPLSRAMESDQFPWATEQFRRGHMVRFSRLDELPEQAAIDRQSYQRSGTRSILSLPLGAGDSLLGVLSFDSVRTERTWPDALVSRLQLLSEVFAGALERRREELALNKRLRFEALLSELYAVFSGLPVLEIDYEITQGLRRIVDFLEVDRGSLVKFSEDRLTAQTTHSWAADRIAQAPSAIALDQIPWTAAQLQGGVAVRFSRLEEIPGEEAAMDRRTYLALGIKSRVEIPLMIGDTVGGALALSTLAAERTWRDELVERLRLFGEMFANNLARKQSELEAQGLRNELAHAGRVATIGELTTSLAHELNQPLTAILSNAQAGQRALETAPVNLEEVGEILKDIVEDDKRAGDVIRRLRSLLTKGDPQMKALDLNEALDEVARLVSADSDVRGVSIRLELADGLPPVLGDRVQLQQVALNLVLNGMDAMRESGTPDRVLVLRTARADAKTVRVEVRDAGTGINEGDMGKIFQTFFTTKPGGMGMGLAITRSIVDVHGGHLEAHNNPDGGATFSFTLPTGHDGP
ncbi:MAG: ATP-binding protein [Candidatus Rokubacteria bacterium]|nr:ATP-binding protein [Candidatus Rokubacteria bacterium]